MYMDSERFTCQELLFKPYLNGFEFDGLDKAVINSIKRCDRNIQKDLYSNIILSGGGTLATNFPERFLREIQLSAPSSTYVKVVADNLRKHGTWIGGSIFASLSNYKRISITREEYNDDQKICNTKINSTNHLSRK